MDRLLNTIPVVGLAVAFALLWAWLGFFEALGIIVAAVFVLMAVLVVMGPK